PRTLSGLSGVVAAPFLHGSLSHLMANTGALLVLGGLLALRGVATFVTVTAALTLLSGAAVWCCARPAVHIGASGLIFGYFGYLVALGWYERTPAALLMALVVAFVYGGMLWGLMPANNGVSWEAHLAGFLAGVLAASWRARRV
ncbi:MAG: rhomboid family intramembrane serine protease, partial [Pseudomonadota bacterium]